MIDLHTHSTASDGSLSPFELIQAAKDGGLSAIALTDHDTINGIEEASKAAENLGVGFIPGVELEIRWEPGEFHLLGLGIRRLDGAFHALLEELARRREERNLRIMDRMRELSLDLNYDDIRALAGGGSVGRPHFAAALVNRGIVRSREQAFSLFLGKGRPLYVPKEGLELGKALELIKEAGGIAVLAHPMSLYVSWGRLPGLVKDLAEQGLDGIEAWHPTAKVRSCKRLEELAVHLGLFVTAGSDFHGESRPDRKLGITAGGRKIEESILAAIPPLGANFFPQALADRR
jgi:predicted metal-dependent phosphoesterase TrpH